RALLLNHAMGKRHMQLVKQRPRRHTEGVMRLAKVRRENVQQRERLGPEIEPYVRNSDPLVFPSSGQRCTQTYRASSGVLGSHSKLWDRSSANTPFARGPAGASEHRNYFYVSRTSNRLTSPFSTRKMCPTILSTRRLPWRSRTT